LQTINSLSSTLIRERRFHDAEKLLREAVDIQGRVLGNDHPQTLQSMDILATTLMEQGRFSDAEIVLRKILDSEGRVSSEELPTTLNNLGVTLLREGRYAEAEKWTREGVEKEVALLGPESPQAALYVYNLACIEALSGKPDAAIRDLSHALEHGLAAYVLLEMGNDPDLKPLHGDSRFTQLVALAKARAGKH
jgi:Flp pilus assembly protein TadD